MLSVQEPIVCQLCREPIWNFLCIDCLGKNVGKWLPKDLSAEFTKFHTDLRDHFHTLVADNYEPCLDCDTLNETPICPYCYTHEVYHWISAKNPAIASVFSKLFFFYPFEGSEHIKSEIGPIEETQNEMPGLGLCDSCGEYSELLGKANGGLYCEICKDQ